MNAILEHIIIGLLIVHLNNIGVVYNTYKQWHIEYKAKIYTNK